MHFTDEELIAYLFGDATPTLARQVEDQVSNSPELFERLEQFRTLLGHLDSLDGQPESRFEPPTGLVESTMDRIFHNEEGLGGCVEREHATDYGDAVKASAAEQRHRTATRLSATCEAPRSRRSLWDSTALTISLTILCCLALPALVRARFEARRAQCAENMRITGRGLLDFALNDPRQRLPGIAMSGPLAFVGAYAMHLNNAGLLQSAGQLSCPSLSRQLDLAKLEALGLDQQFVKQGSLRIPTEAELLALPEQQLPVIQSLVGGSYAYTLGVVENNRPVPPRHQGSTHFAILADAPLFMDGRELFIAHDGFGVNILFDDGRVHFFSTARLNAARSAPMEIEFLWDDPFCNERREHRAGLHEHDASLAPSHYSPLGAK